MIQNKTQCSLSKLQDLFNVIYGKKIILDFKSGKLNSEGEPLEPSPEERPHHDSSLFCFRLIDRLLILYHLVSGGKALSSELHF
jgi:hypothetical protein